MIHNFYNEFLLNETPLCNNCTDCIVFLVNINSEYKYHSFDTICGHYFNKLIERNITYHPKYEYKTNYDISIYNIIAIILFPICLLLIIILMIIKCWKIFKK